MEIIAQCDVLKDFMLQKSWRHLVSFFIVNIFYISLFLNIHCPKILKNYFPFYLLLSACFQDLKYKRYLLKKICKCVIRLFIISAHEEVLSKIMLNLSVGSPEVVLKGKDLVDPRRNTQDPIADNKTVVSECVTPTGTKQKKNIVNNLEENTLNCKTLQPTFLEDKFLNVVEKEVADFVICEDGLLRPGNIDTECNETKIIESVVMEMQKIEVPKQVNEKKLSKPKLLFSEVITGFDLKPFHASHRNASVPNCEESFKTVDSNSSLTETVGTEMLDNNENILGTKIISESFDIDENIFDTTTCSKLFDVGENILETTTCSKSFDVEENLVEKNDFSNSVEELEETQNVTSGK